MRQQRCRHTNRERETEEMRETLNERWEKGLRKGEIDRRRDGENGGTDTGKGGGGYNKVRLAQFGGYNKLRSSWRSLGV